MRKEQKQKILNFINLFPDIQQTIEQISVNHHVAAEELLQESVKGLELVKNAIEASEGAEHVACMYVEKCIQVFPNADKTIWKELRECIENEIKVKREVVFLPYKASMWDSLESVWMAARDDEECDAYVIPIPYYDKDSEGNLKEMHWEGGEYPDYVPITRYDEYHIAERRPDMIFIHNPYDNRNHVTSVHPDYYAEVLKDYTDKLVYIPYYILPAAPAEKDKGFVLSSGVLYADYVFVQNDEVREFYLNVIKENWGREPVAKWEEKLIALGSPKTDKILNTKKEDLQVPEEWKKIIRNKKVVFFNTNISMILHNSDNIIENLERILGLFKKHTEFVVIWREHPLTMSTLESMRPEIMGAYIKLRDDFVKEKWGILDETPEPYMAMSLSDCYYGAGGSLSAVYPVTGKPIMIMDYLYPAQIEKVEITAQELMERASLRMLFPERNVNSLEIFLGHISEFEKQNAERKEKQQVRMKNLDGTVGKRIFLYMKTII